MTRKLRRSEDGSIALSLIMILVLTSTALVIAATVTSGQQQSRHDARFEQALRVAEMGLDRLVSDVKVAVNLDPLAPQSSVTNIPWTTDTNTGLQYRAEAVRTLAVDGNALWTVKAWGRLDGTTVEREIEAKVSVGSAFDLAVYARSGITMNGANSADSYNSNNPLYPGIGNAVTRQGNNVEMTYPTGNGRIGTEGNLVLQGNTVGNVDGVDVFFAIQSLLPTGVTALDGATGNCSPLSDCPDLVAHREHFPEVTTTVCDNATYSAPYTGTLQPGINSFSNTVITLTNSSMPTLAAGQTVILCAKGTLVLNGHTTGINMNTDGTPKFAGNLYIFLDEAAGAVPALTFTNHCEISAAIHAPTASFTGAGAQCEIFGSMVVNSLSTQGGVAFHYDDALRSSQVNIPVTVTDWREVE